MPTEELTDPTEDTSPVANTTAGVWSWDDPIETIAFGSVDVGTNIYIRFNSDDAASATVGEYDLMLQNNGSFMGRVCELGLRSVTSVSVWFPTGSTVGNFYLRGA